VFEYVFGVWVLRSVAVVKPPLRLTPANGKEILATGRTMIGYRAADCTHRSWTGERDAAFLAGIIGPSPRYIGRGDMSTGGSPRPRAVTPTAVSHRSPRPTATPPSRPASGAGRCGIAPYPADDLPAGTCSAIRTSGTSACELDLIGGSEARVDFVYTRRAPADCPRPAGRLTRADLPVHQRPGARSRLLNVRSHRMRRSALRDC
jgi:hypothetical protein